MISAEKAREALKDLEPIIIKDELSRIDKRVQLAICAGLSHFKIPFDICDATEEQLKLNGYKVKTLDNGDKILIW